MKIALCVFAAFAFVVISSVAIKKYIEVARIRAAESLRLALIEGEKDDCMFGFKGSVIYHGDLILARGEVLHNMDTYQRSKARCGELGVGPMRTDDPKTAPGIGHYTDLFLRN